ncbi:MAG TPA: GNAT family N-acetyltransferase [Stellaceae bacterium]|jgi:ribosomal protein S18 acetylase RimI-like enzyme|nr:GNAT family N-acetyltransferase [Stellaceae bacterium]
MQLSGRGAKEGQAAGSQPTDGAPGLRVDVTSLPDAADVAVLERGLHAYEAARLGPPGHGHFAVLLRDDRDRVIGGVDGHVMWRRLFIKTVWLPETVRGRGWGTRLMQEVEREARRRACLSIWLTALGPRACHFYRRLGFEVIGVLEDYVLGEPLYTLHKIF